jgi:hypothetical protein
VYQTERPVNAAVISPLKYHVLLGGGQDAMSVATAARSQVSKCARVPGACCKQFVQGKFETRFFHMIYQEEFGRVPGHFGPINALAIHPTGRRSVFKSCTIILLFFKRYAATPAVQKTATFACIISTITTCKWTTRY